MCHRFVEIWTSEAKYHQTDMAVAATVLLNDLVHIACYVGKATDQAFWDGFQSSIPLRSTAKHLFVKFTKRMDEQEERRAKQEERRAKQALLDAVPYSENAVWSLHMILADMDFPSGKPPVDTNAKRQLQAIFGWTLSFSRAFHGGPQGLVAWFTKAGIDVMALANEYQCASQESAAFRLADASVVDTPFVGVHRVESRYEVFDESSRPRAGAEYSQGPLLSPKAQTRTEATSLLMFAPILDESVDKDTFMASEVIAAVVPVTIPLVRAQLFDERPRAISGRRNVYRMPFLMTPPRMHLMLRLAHCMGEGGIGASLTGMHGTGMSVFLKAFSTVLPAGYPCDMLLISNASDLWLEPERVGQQLAQSSGPIVDSRARGAMSARTLGVTITSLEANQQKVKDQWQLGAQDQAQSTTLRQLLESASIGKQTYSHAELCMAVCDAATSPWPHKAYGRVLIFDEVKQLMRMVADDCTQTGLGAGSAVSFGAVPDCKTSASPPRKNKLKTLGASSGPRKPKKPKKGAASSFGTAASPQGPPSGYWNMWLPWNLDPGSRCFRIMASPPNGAREKRPARVYEVFYELRPTRLDHLAAILYAAPEFVLPHHNLSQSITNSGAALVRAKEACQTLCGNMRYLAQYFELFAQRVKDLSKSTAPAAAAAVHAIHVSSLRTIQQGYVDKLAERLMKAFRNPSELQARSYAEENALGANFMPGVVPPNLFNLMAKNASLVVRTNPIASAGPYDLLGSVSVAALRAHLADRGRHANIGASADRAAAGLFLQEWEAKWDGSVLVDLVQIRLALSALAARAWRLDQLWRLAPAALSLESLCERHKLWTPESAYGEPCADLADALHQNRAWWVSAFEWATQQVPNMFVHQVRQSVANMPSLVDPDVLHSIKACLQNGGILLIRTADSFPGVDFVLLRVPSSPEACSATFVKATNRSLRNHAKSKTSPFPAALQDIAAITVPTYGAAQHEDGSWWRTSTPEEGLPKGWKAKPPTSILNFWLRVLGCPKRVRAILNEPELNHLTLALEDASAAAGSGEDVSSCEISLSLGESSHDHSIGSACDPTRRWDVSMLYVSTSNKLVEQPSEYASLHADFVYGIFKPDFNDALEAWAHRPQEPASGAAES